MLGVVAGLAIVLLPVEAAFAGDPLLRLGSFGSAPAPVVAGVRCGSPLGNLGRRSDGLSLATLAKDRACREAAARRVATGVAVVGVLGAIGAIGLAAGPRSRVGIA